MVSGGGATLWIVGMMGVGKSAVARELAARLGRPWLDTDREVERSAGASIPEIFASEGEAAFRQRERTAIEAVAGRPVVVAIGGGAMAQAGIPELLSASGTVVRLKASAETLLARVGEAADRPLLAGRPPRDRLGRIRALMAEREPHYARADFHVAADVGDPGQVADRVLETLAAEER